MGLLSWFFPSPADRVARARKLLEKGQWADARHEALDAGEHPGAEEVVSLASRNLALINLEAAVSWAEAGDEPRVNTHLDLAREFRQPDMADDFASARQRILDAREARRAASEADARKDAGRLAQIHPGFRDAHGSADLPIPDGTPPEALDAVRARLALLHEAYPESLRDGMLELGAPFAGAVLDLDDGNAQQALDALTHLPGTAPLVQHERARAHLALSNNQAAAGCWMRFAELAGAHHPIGTQHTAVLLAQVLTELGRVPEARTTLEAARAQGDPLLGGTLYAAILEAQGELPAAESELRNLIQRHGPHPGLHVMLARVRLAGGHRTAAMQALEASLAANPCTPGRGGSRPPDLATHRMLATLYLEDGIETERALDLAETARTLVQKPTWDDIYLAALAAHRDASPDAADLATRLRDVTPEGDPRRERVEALLGA